MQFYFLSKSPFLTVPYDEHYNYGLGLVIQALLKNALRIYRGEILGGSIQSLLAQSADGINHSAVYSLEAKLCYEH